MKALAAMALVILVLVGLTWIVMYQLIAWTDRRKRRTTRMLR